MSAANVVTNHADPLETFDVRERRMSPRVTTLMRAAKLIGLTGEYPCVVRDVSETGLRVKLFHPLPEHRLALELAPGVHYFVECVWENGGEAGFLSAAAIEVDEFLAVIGRKDGPAWFKTWVSGSVRSRDAKARVTVSALSQQGADIETGAHFALDELVVLEADGMPPLHARVAGRTLSGYRLILADAHRLDELAKLIWSLPRWDAESRLELLDGGKADEDPAVQPARA
jgi:hypothetical protein